jgi:hypothetical protein
MGILWTILIGFIAGILAKFLVPGDPNLRASSRDHFGNRWSLRRDLPWSGSRLVSSRRGSRTYWRDRGRHPYSVNLGLHRIEAPNAIARFGDTDTARRNPSRMREPIHSLAR